MASESNSDQEAWSRSALTVALWFAYTPAFLFSPDAAKRAFRALPDHELWALALYAVVSSVCVFLALVALTVLVRRVAPRTRKKLSLFLLISWLPHTGVVWLLWFLDVIRQPGAWID